MAQLFTITFVLLLLNLSGTFTKYIYVEEKMDWFDAQAYCRHNYTDLAPVSSAKDFNHLRRLSVNVSGYYWIGLERNSSNNTSWSWSGGGPVSKQLWEQNQPDDCQGNENGGCVKNNKWYDADQSYQTTFFCYSVKVVTEKKTWEEALEYCRKNFSDLASVASQTEMLLIQNEVSKENLTDLVWIGLRYLPGDWLWIDGQEMVYDAWGTGGNQTCPQPKMKCGALQVMGADEGFWEARDCAEPLHFVCY